MTQAPHSVTELAPRAVWHHFAALSTVPRPSKREERVRAHVRSVCEGLGLAVAEDDAGNLVASVPASEGRENAPTVVLQAHLDMVCEKNAGTEHDFDQDPIQLILDQDEDGQAIVRANGTTLGADNGIGVALMLAAASESISRGPLELLFTVDEEEGMGGAIGLDPSLISGKVLLNLDTEEDDMLYIGCAGGCDSTLRWHLPTAPVEGGVTCSITLRGLRGGHSGGDIHQGRGSATKLIARLLGRVGNGLRLVSIAGGSKRNALAREAHAVVVVDESTAASLSKLATEVAEEARVESREPDVTITVDRADDATSAASADDSLRLIHALLALPHGPTGMHPDIPTLVETSNNLATIATTVGDDGMHLVVGCLSRSSSESRLDEILGQIAGIAGLAGATVENGNRYPGWEPNVDSPTLAVAKRVHEDCFGVLPAAEAVHAGLECGLLGQKLPGTDMISLGPRIEGAHSPDERVWVASVERSWTYLVGLLDTLST